MPDINVKGRYRIYTHDGVEPLLFTSYSNSLCSIRRPNPNTFITISTYIPGSLSPFTTFDPGSSYTIVTKSNTADFSMGPYTRVDRLPSSVTFRSPNFYHGLDKNSITVALSSYALSVNSPLSTAFTYIPNQDGYFINSISFNTERLRQGLPSLLTHLTPNSSYQFINRTPFTFFAPLQSEMGDAYATGYNQTGQLGMGYLYNSFDYTQLYGNWDKVVTSVTHSAALSTCGTTKKLFVCGSNTFGQLGLTQVAGGTLQPSVTATQTVWKQLQSIWTWDFNNNTYRDILLTENILDAEVGDGFTLIQTNVQLYGCGIMCYMGIAPPGAQGYSGYQFNGVQGSGFTNYYVPYFTSYLNRSTVSTFTPNQGSDYVLYNPITSIKKFQARNMRWYWLDNGAGRLYGAGKIGGTTGGLGRSSSSIDLPGVLPIGQSSTSSDPNYASLVQLYGPGTPSTRYNNQFFGDFNASPTNIVALSSNYITWLVGGAMSSSTNSSSLSTICFFDPAQNAYIPQNDYFLRLFPTFYGCMGIINGKLYFSGSVTSNGVHGAGNSVSSRLPASTLPRLNGALGANPQEEIRLRSLIPLTYMGQPDISWKSLHCGQLVTAAIDNNNKLYVCGNNNIGILGAPSNPTSNLITTLTQIIPDDIYNVNTNDVNLVVYKTNRNPAPSPGPIPSPTPTPSVTPVSPFYNTGEIMYTKRAGSGGYLREDGMTENSSVWYDNIQYSNALACGTQVAGVSPYKMMRLSLNPSIYPQAQYGQYDHYSYAMLFLKPQIEPQSFGSRKCFVFSASPSVGGVIGGYKDLCFHYFSQAYRPDLPICSGPLSIVSKMAPNSGTFGDGRSSRQRMEIKTNVGENCLVDFYIKPEDNSYHVIFTAKRYPDDSDSSRDVLPYYTKSTNRGDSWSTPLLIGSNYYNPRSHDWYPCRTGGYNPNTVDPAITNKKGNDDKPAVLVMEQNGGEYDPYNVVCKYTYNTRFDRTVTLASGYLYGNYNLPPWYNDAPRLNFDAQFAHFKILYDNANRLITLWTGTAGPTMTQQRTNYVGQGRSRVVYRYLTDENSNTWSPLVTACRTFPHSNIATGGTRPYVDVGRYWDACIDDSDNNLCILYTPDPSNSGGYSFSAFTAKVIKINITTGSTIYDEIVLDITSLPMGVDYYPKSIGSVNLYYDSQLNKLVAQCFTRNIQGNDGKLYRMQRNSTNNWSEIPYLGASDSGIPSAGARSDNWITIQRNVRT